MKSSTLKLKTLIFIASLVFLTQLHAQKGNIRGTVFEAASGDFLPGVTIVIEGTTTGTITDLDGKFDLSADPGIYDLRISYVSFETIILEQIEVVADEVLVLDDMGLKEANLTISEAVVTGQRIRNTETALMAIKRKSPNLMDGISSASFRKIGDSDAASSMKRVPGVSVMEGKYVFVRGLGDRYTKTILNGVDLPGLDPDRNSLQMDIFPTNVIDNIIVYKSFSAELPADFTGGVVDIATKDFPEEKVAKVAIGTGYNPLAHFNTDYLTYEGGKTDWLGFDDGTRAIPAGQGERIPFFIEASQDPNGTSGQRYREILEGFNPTMAAHKDKSFMNYGLSASFGNQVTREKIKIGYMLAVSYKSTTSFYEDAEFGRYGLYGDPDIYEMEPRSFRKGNIGEHNTFVSGLAGFAIKTNKSKYRFNLMHLQNGESKAGIFDFQSTDQGTIFDGWQHALDYSQRSLSNVLISGKHSYTNSKWELEWKLSPTFSRMYDPDIRFTRYVGTEQDPIIGTESGFPERLWRDLDEINLAGVINTAKEFTFNNQKSKLKFGLAYTYKERDYTVLKYAINVRDIPLTGDPDELFLEENLWPYQGDPYRGTTYEADFVPENANEYNASNMNTAGYVSIEFGIFRGLKTILGIRAENYYQEYEKQDVNEILEVEGKFLNLDIFPSVNLIYGLTQKQNLRFSYSKTIARPSFKELSKAEIYDPISDLTFVGGLFREENNGVVYWDGKLTNTDIHNFDLRWEYFMEKGQMLSLSGFYKSFDNPIELVQYATYPGAYQPRNVGNGEVFGGELEMRVSLESLSDALRSIIITSNVTVAKSRIKMSTTEYESRVYNARTGQSISQYRDMAGQAPVLINCGIAYDGGAGGFWKGLEAGLYYNMQGQTLEIVGSSDKPDIYTMPFHSLNFNSTKKFGEKQRFHIGFKISNLLNETKLSLYKSYSAADQVFERLKLGMTYSVTIGYSFF